MLALAGLLLLALASSPPLQAQGGQGNPRVLPPRSLPQGKTYAEWSVAWWQWFMGLPLISPAGVTHPGIDDPGFDVAEGQSGSVWFLAAPFPGTHERTCTIPAGKALFFGTMVSEWSSLEGYATYEEQSYLAWLFAEHIVDLSVTIDGVPVKNLAAYRLQSPQFEFTAPTPWIFGPEGGAGTAVAEGYYFFLAPLAAGQHTIHCQGAFYFSTADGDPFDLSAPLDMTYHLTVR
jgi:hypothetical protein